MTELQKIYRKELKRIQRFMRDAERRGYTFAVQIKEVIRPTKKSIEKLKGLTPQKLYEKSVYYDPLTAKHIKGEEGRQLERSRAAKRGWKTRKEAAHRTTSEADTAGQHAPPNESDLILSRLEQTLSTWAPLTTWDAYYTKIKTNDKNILQRILEGAIASLGRNQVARNAKDNAQRIIELAEIICYGESKHKWADIQADFAEITNILYGTLSVEQSKHIEEIIEQVLGYAPEEI